VSKEQSIQPSSPLGDGARAYVSALGFAHEPWSGFAEALQIPAGFSLMDAFPEDIMQARVQDALTLLGVWCGTLVGISLLLSVPVLTVWFTKRAEASATFSSACGILGFALGAWVVIASLEGVATACRSSTLTAAVGALTLMLLAVFVKGPGVSDLTYPSISLSAGIAVGSLATWSTREAHWNWVLATESIVLFALFGIALYLAAQTYADAAGKIVGTALSVALVIVLGRRAGDLTLSAAWRTTAPVGTLVAILAAFAKPGDMRAEAWDYQLWVGIAAGTAILVFDCALRRSIGRAFLAMPTLWAIVSLFAFKYVPSWHLNIKHVRTLTLDPFLGALLGALGAWLWKPRAPKPTKSG